MALFKIETEDDSGLWSDAYSEGGVLMTFASEQAAHEKLAELFPVLVGLEKYGGHKRTRVVRVYNSDAEWNEGTAPE